MPQALHTALRPVLLAALALAVALPAPAADARRPGHAVKMKAKAKKKCVRAKHSRAAKRRCRRNPRPAATRPAPAPSRLPAQAPGAAAPRPPAAPGPARARLFSATSFWNLELAPDAPLDAASPALVAALSREVSREVGANTGPWINTSRYSVPVYTVDAEVPAVRVTLDTGVAALQQDFAAVPIPANAHAAAGGDQHLVVYQPSSDTLWEFWHAARLADGWHARWGGKMTNVSHNPGYFPAPYGATATSLPLLGGLMTIQELGAGRIDHALALAIPTTGPRVTWPAQRGDGRTIGADAIPEGTRFRIDPALDLSTLRLSPVALAMARAAQRYGIVVRDTAGCVVFYAEDPTVMGGDPYGQIFGGRYPNQLLREFPWDRLQVVAPYH